MEENFIRSIADSFYLQALGLVSPEGEIGRDSKTDALLTALAEREGWADSLIEDVEDVISSGVRCGYIKGFQCAVALMQDGKEGRP